MIMGEEIAVMDIVVATNNPGKLEELREIAQDWPVRLVGPQELGLVPDALETGSSFDENALIKARSLHRQAGSWVMADDSGLVVDYIEGAPGIYSARYAGDAATDRENCDLLLEHLKKAGPGERQAHFHCSLAVISPDGREALYHGRTDGSIARAASGTAGFGYDPVFVPLGGQDTLAELPPHEKNAISHRGQALRLFLEQQFARPAGLERER